MLEPIPFYHDNDFPLLIGPIRQLVNGTPTPITTGDIELFLATSKGGNAADASLSGLATHVGGQSDGNGDTYDQGMWLFLLNASVMTKALLTQHFKGKTAYIIARLTDDFRVYREAIYAGDRPAD